jgi:hypothetical protein
LSYVLIGAGLAPHLDGERLVATLLAFGLAVGVAAHALDELRGRPLGTSVPSPALATAAAVSLALAAGLGAAGVSRVGWGLCLFVVLGTALVLGYNLELCGGLLHRDAVFAAAWGAFPVLTAYFAQTGTLRLAALLAAVAAFGLSHTQRVLSTEARRLRRRVVHLDGRSVLGDGSSQPLTKALLLRPLERSLQALSWSCVAFGLALVAVHAH